jgi:hypothetical protein
VDSDRLNRWLTLGANIGVVIGIILLIVELDQNRDMMRAQIRNELARGVSDFLPSIVDDREFADALVRAGAGEPLTPAEELQINAWYDQVFGYWQNVHYQYRHGLYDEGEFSRHTEAIAAVLEENPKSYSYWCNERLHFSVPFMEFMDDLLGGPSC